MPAAIVCQSQAKISHSGEVQTVAKKTDLSVMKKEYPLMRFASSPHRSDHGAVFFFLFQFSLLLVTLNSFDSFPFTETNTGTGIVILL